MYIFNKVLLNLISELSRITQYMKLKTQQMSRKCYNRSKSILYIIISQLYYKVTIFVLVRIEFKFWHKITFYIVFSMVYSV